MPTQTAPSGHMFLSTEGKEPILGIRRESYPKGVETRRFLALPNVDLAYRSRRNAILLGALRERARIHGATFDWTYEEIVTEGVRGKYHRSSISEGLRELAVDGSIAKQSNGRGLRITLRCPEAGPQKSTNRMVAINNAPARQTPERVTREKQNIPTKSETETKPPEVSKTQDEKTQKQNTAMMPDADTREAAELLKTCCGFNHAYAYRLARIYPAARIYDAYAAWYGGTWNDPPRVLADAVVKGYRPSPRQRAAMPKMQVFQSPVGKLAEIPGNSSQPGAPKNPVATEWKRPDDWRREELTEAEQAEITELQTRIAQAAAAKSMPGHGWAGGKNGDEYSTLVGASRVAKLETQDEVLARAVANAAGRAAARKASE